MPTPTPTPRDELPPSPSLADEWRANERWKVGVDVVLAMLAVVVELAVLAVLAAMAALALANGRDPNN